MTMHGIDKCPVKRVLVDTRAKKKKIVLQMFQGDGFE